MHNLPRYCRLVQPRLYFLHGRRNAVVGGHWCLHNYQRSFLSSQNILDNMEARTTLNYCWPNMYEEAHDMMMASFVSYPITFILREAKANRLRDSEAILEKFHDALDDNMKTSVSPLVLMDVVRDNIQYLKANYPIGSKEFGWYSVLKLYEKMSLKEDPKDIALMEFDDKQETRRLVYAIGVNKRLKRITIIFRGTYAEETRDWARNLQFGMVEIPRPSARGTSATAFVHKGVYEYMYRNLERGNECPRESNEEILEHLLECLEDYPEYKVYITGHSMGGALALLLSFFAAADHRIPKPVTCISLGSFLVGDFNFQLAVEELESVGWLRHLRITNEDDPVPSLPPFEWYKPVGLHLDLHQETGFNMFHSRVNQVDARNSLSHLWKTYQQSFGSSLEELLKPHMIPEYLRRLERERENLEVLSVNDCYQDETIVGRDFPTQF